MNSSKWPKRSEIAAARAQVAFHKRHGEPIPEWMETIARIPLVDPEVPVEDQAAEAEREIEYWKGQFKILLREYKKVSPYGVYGFTGGRAPSPREQKSIKDALDRVNADPITEAYGKPNPGGEGPML